MKGIISKNSLKYQNVILRLGGFHIAENFQGAIGNFMKGSGIEEVLYTSGVCAKGTINKVLNGKDYYKMIRCHLLVAEVMKRLKWEAFEDWLIEEGQAEILEPLAEHLNTLLLSLKKGNLD